MKLKKIIATALSVILIGQIGVVNVSAHSNIENRDYNNSISFNYTDNILINNEVQLPKEVEEYVQEILDNNPQAEIEVAMPYEDISDYEQDIFGIQRAMSSNYTSYRNYNGMQVRDYIVTVTNATSMTPISYNSNVNLNGIIYAILGASNKYVGATQTAISILQALGEPTSIYSPYGDKLSAQLKYTSITKFTYVKHSWQSSSEEMLGAVTYSSKLEELRWNYYSSKEHRIYERTVQYNNTYKSANYNNPDAIATQWYSIGGGYHDSEIYFKVGNKDFYLR